MPRIHFQLQLAELKDKLLAMAALAQQAVESAVDAYLQRDKGLCQYVKQNETAINTAQRELDEMAFEASVNVVSPSYWSLWFFGISNLGICDRMLI